MLHSRSATILILMSMSIQKSQYRSWQLRPASLENSHFQGKIVNFFFAGAPPPNPSKGAICSSPIISDPGLSLIIEPTRSAKVD